MNDATGCKALWSAVMSRAILDVRKKPRASMRPAQKNGAGYLKRTAETWLTAKQNKDAGSFLWVCESLEIDPDRTRKLIFKAD